VTTNLRKFLSLTTALVMTSSAVAYAEPSAELIEAAKKEGMLTTIALPHDW
jgi:putative spermidine/putrescine transport system substrate-binding protein